MEIHLRYCVAWHEGVGKPKKCNTATSLSRKSTLSALLWNCAVSFPSSNLLFSACQKKTTRHLHGKGSSPFICEVFAGSPRKLTIDEKHASVVQDVISIVVPCTQTPTLTAHLVRQCATIMS